MDCELERRSEEYGRKQEKRSTSPHIVIGLLVAACGGRDEGGEYRYGIRH